MKIVIRKKAIRNQQKMKLYQLPVNTESGQNNKSTTRKYDTKDKEIADKTVSNNNNNESKSVKKKVFILGDSIIKHVKSYCLSKSLDNCKVYVKDFPVARVRCM